MNPKLQLALWVAGSFAVGLAAVAAVYRFGGARLRRALVESELGSVFVEVVRFSYYIGLPFGALITGALSVDLLGLGAIAVEDASTLAGFTLRDWMRGSIAAGLATGFVLVVLWLARRSADLPPALFDAQPSALLIVREAAYAEAHWAFYRAPFVLLFQDAYWGATAGFALVAVEWVLARRLRHTPPHANRPHALAATCCMLTSGLLYVTARNLWLMIVAHAAIRRVGERLFTQTAPPAAPYRRAPN
ncbi:MAG: hypothetical protein CUN48_06090 [Candidatus Thermofonsia Clade 3 bacterium]|jgi:hypothetical protein|uniref:CPBP family intramembrane metalloprotease n=1 Tax=Candidatus Thermofonsia Clade 3 bacterium TaxID=2364212 RepID=A0A2M8QDN6_9CHLR|nr:hypothetical protein [Candidatus Roseilinea sp. NK_OTU-006]PJF47917.1 MAG: hypothetical protein CUN48_06090 [Candidatus Thermofonsia Clade 3 bacterium]